MLFECELQKEPDESTEITWLKAGKVIPDSERVSDFFDILKRGHPQCHSSVSYRKNLMSPQRLHGSKAEKLSQKVRG